MSIKIDDICTYAPKSGIKAGEATKDGQYMFFTSSEDESKRYTDYLYDGEGIIMGTGGNATLHYYHGKYAVSTDCIVLRPDDRIRCKYLYYFFLANMSILEAGFKGAGLKHTNKKYIGSISIPEIPSIDEQDRVIVVLDKVIGIIKSRKHEIDALDDLIKARFVEMFGDMADPECKWDRCRIIDTCVSADDIKCGPFGTQLGKDEYTTEGIAIWEIPQINVEFKTDPTHFIAVEKARALEAYSIIPGDIAMSRKGNVGRCAVFPENYKTGIIHSDVLRIRVDNKKIAPKFMMRQLHYSRDIEHQIELVSSGAIMAGINVTKLKQIYVCVPPKQLQDKFVDLVDQVDKSKVV